MDLDLHIHSTASDGSLRPDEVVAAAVGARLDVIAITDHDTVAGIPSALAAAASHALQVVPALEVSTTWNDLELHILGYFVDPWNAELVAHTHRALESRAGRLRGMVARLRDQGVEISFEMVEEAQLDPGALGRPHLARALVAAGVVDSVPAAFDLYIGNGHPAYIPTRLLEPAEAIRLIRNAGGISVWAHPPMQYLHELLPGLRESGLGGVEVYRPRAPRERMLRLEKAARSKGMFVSGGSDWHGPDDGPLGEFRLQATEVADLLDAGGM